VLGASLKAGESATHALGRERRAYLVADRGAVEVNGRRAGARDGVVVTQEETVTITAPEDAEVVLADVA
jgi:redox-sensitive bicupin YhaK (pirin superfamily)